MTGAAIVVYTCHTNGRDALRADQCVEAARFEAFVDDPAEADGVWTQRRAATACDSPRRNARMHKILAHRFVDAPYSVWMDANVALKVPAWRLVDEYLRDADLAVFQHRTRSCTYDEAARCRELGLDAPDIIDAQVRRYRAEGFPSGLGLPETSVLVRRHTPRVREFNELWWRELRRHSVRDQISFMVAATRAGLSVHFITPTKFDHPYFSMTVRPAGIEPAAGAT